MFRILLKPLAVALGALFPVAVAAGDTQPLSDIVQAEILPGWQTPDGTYMAGLRLNLAPGWKTYWRAPGDAGIPPLFSWTGSQNVTGAQVHWPRPTVFHQNGMRAIGYDGEIVLPIELSLARTDAPLSVRGEVTIGICEEICVPVTLNLRADLPQSGQAEAASIRAALRQRPESGDRAGVGPVTCQVDPIDDGLRLTARIPVRGIGAGDAAVVETADPSVWVSEPALSSADGILTAVADLVPADAAPFALDRSKLRITLLSGKTAIDIQGCSGG